MRYKYPRTPHLPCSPGSTSDDKKLDNDEHLKGRLVVITEKLDGENTTLYPDGYIHARSTTYSPHDSRNKIKNTWAGRCYKIPDYYRICGENIQAKHSLDYSHLDDKFFIFSLWNEHTCMSWEETEIMARHVEFPLVPVLYRGIYSEGVISNLITNLDFSKSEGFVVRIEDSFELEDFYLSMAKYVRENHVDSKSEHWLKYRPEK